jgi:hypothetical protein
MTRVEQQELVRAARARLDDARRLLDSEVIHGRITQNLSDRLAGVRKAISELRELKR